MIRVFVGYDERESVAYHVACQSIIDNTKADIRITPLRTDKMRAGGLYYRDDDPLSSNAFSYTRFLVPYLSAYAGTSVYLDPDVVVRGDLGELVRMCDQMLTPVYVAKHDYTPKLDEKYFGAKQHKYPKKNWSSVMVFRNSSCQFQLTPENVNTQPPAWLHQMQWVSGNREVGSIPLEWNWLVDEYPHNDDAKILHYTNGIPMIEGFGDCDHSKDWWHYFNRMIRARR